MTTEAVPVATPASPRIITTLEEFLALPDDGVERWVIRGQLRERRGEHPMTVRNPFHSRIVSRVAAALVNWLEQQPGPRGDALTGDAGIRLPGTPVTVVGIDIAYIAPEVASQTDATTLIDGVPTIAVEILSPNDTQADVLEKIDLYLAAGVAHTWIIDPHWQTVTVYQPGGRPQLFNIGQDISAEPHLPGFRVPVARLFE